MKKYSMLYPESGIRKIYRDVYLADCVDKKIAQLKITAIQEMLDNCPWLDVYSDTHRQYNIKRGIESYLANLEEKSDGKINNINTAEKRLS